MRFISLVARVTVLLPLAIGWGSLTSFGCRGKNLDSDASNGLVLKRARYKIPAGGIVKVQLENLSGGHAIGVNSTPEVKDGDIERIDISTGSMSAIEIGRKGTFVDLVGAQFIAMVYANGQTELSFHFREELNSREIEIFVMRSVLQTKP